MNAKLLVLVALMFLSAPVVSLAQSSGDANSVESINLADTPTDSIVVLSKHESGIPGYVYLRYAFVHPNCLGGLQMVDYYGSGFDVNDPVVRRSERRYCSQGGEERDGE